VICVDIGWVMLGLASVLVIVGYKVAIFGGSNGNN
jgi:hypothetical protein